MPGLAWSNWFWRDWDSDPGLRLCSFAAQGLWMRMLCIAAASERPGYVMVAGRACSVGDIARIAGGSVEEVSDLVSELEKGGVFSVDAEKVIFCRRMVRETERLRQFRESGKRGGRPRNVLKTLPEKDNPTLLKKPNPRLTRVRAPDGSGSGSKDSKEVKKVEEGVSVETFETFWRAYPRREDKGHARLAYQRALKKIDAPGLLVSVERYAQRRKGQDPSFTALATTWLNGERWSDEEAQPMLKAVAGFGAPGFG